ncbi:outer membrane protein assembly factor BamE domain-containing protein [Marinobacter sp. OP 3.4]|uniref:outer membrane protein assembly factor BamE domain-containing protein n=1 Tax=Marinobacter sp. OP 3.4 TaxID=3076501 RepID=UPI002E1B1336
MTAPDAISGLRQAAILLCAILGGFPASGSADTATFYKCEGPDGVQFSDRPCSADPDTVTVRDTRVGGSVGDNLPEYEPPKEPADQEEEPAPQEEEDACRFINSTDLRTYLAREQVVPGMTREQVEQAFGRTSEVYPVPQETWVYQTKYYGAIYELTYVYFRNGCVERVEYRKP